METGLKDINGDIIKVGDTLLNPMMQDLWLVEEKNGVFTANLIPNSGFIKHPNDNYPQYVEELEDVCEVFEIYKTV
jgi:hypothetical protein